MTLIATESVYRVADSMKMSIIPLSRSRLRDRNLKYAEVSRRVLQSGNTTIPVIHFSQGSVEHSSLTYP